MIFTVIATLVNISRMSMFTSNTRWVSLDFKWQMVLLTFQNISCKTQLLLFFCFCFLSSNDTHFNTHDNHQYEIINRYRLSVYDTINELPIKPTKYGHIKRVESHHLWITWHLNGNNESILLIVYADIKYNEKSKIVVFI